MVTERSVVRVEPTSPAVAVLHTAAVDVFVQIANEAVITRVFPDTS